MNQIEIVYNYKYKSHTVHKPFSDSHSCIILTQSTKEKKLDNILQNYWLAIKTLINLHKDEQQYNTFYLRQQPESDWNVSENLVFFTFVCPIVFL